MRRRYRLAYYIGDVRHDDPLGETYRRRKSAVRAARMAQDHPLPRLLVPNLPPVRWVVEEVTR